MNRSQHRPGPPRGPAAFGNQDARSNFAVQPAAASAKISLKKPAVKMVRPAGDAAPATAQATQPAVPTPMPADGYVPSPFVASRSQIDHSRPHPTKPDEKTQDPIAKTEVTALQTYQNSLKAELDATTPAGQEDAGESALDSMFARLTASSLSPAPPSQVDEATAGPDASSSSAEQKSSRTALEFLKSYVANAPAEALTKVQEEVPVAEVNVSAEPKNAEAETQGSSWAGMSKQQLEHEYLAKASDYLNSLPEADGTANGPITASSIKTVYTKLRSLSPASGSAFSATVAGFQKKYQDAVVSYINGLHKDNSLTTESVSQFLKEADGDFLQFCVKLVGMKVLDIRNLDQVVGLSKAIAAILPDDAAETKKPVKPTGEEPASKDPMDSMSTWPAREKREHVPRSRTCLLKGVSGVTSLNLLQGLVWGGRMEALSLPEPGSDYALVKFLTAEGCQKYFDATENGIELAPDKAPGGKKTVVFVEQQPGPNSINDVLRNCIEGDATRCVRAYDADEDWSDMALLKLARGKSQIKREVDRIKRGKTGRGRYYIEFRFSTIYHGLNFKRALMDDEDWEHCSISYAPDPCDIARGVHFKDEDEEPAGFFT
ncbi:hypothetical protein BDV95DRAFT_632715 [Massariosphaeria phaeospora]|uniref:Uncharacterized protein n=1 Tax=Massariosphaeria phaeospora TaxID=100035 RepID=A0A7C8MAS0_9PLEO|nr:hypothetical protein BDV95DRAFT_632715 [Massariosphaeria phaeospora]